MKTVDSAMTTAMQEQHGAESLEAAIFKLKLQWMMAKDTAEKKRLSEEIRRRMGSGAI